MGNLLATDLCSTDLCNKKYLTHLLALAVRYGNADSVRGILEQGARDFGTLPVEPYSWVYGSTDILQNSFYKPSVEEYLFDRFHARDLPDRELAPHEERLKSAEALLEYQCCQGSSLLYNALLYGDDEMAAMLESKGIKVSDKHLDMLRGHVSLFENCCFGLKEQLRFVLNSQSDTEAAEILRRLYEKTGCDVPLVRCTLITEKRLYGKLFESAIAYTDFKYTRRFTRLEKLIKYNNEQGFAYGLSKGWLDNESERMFLLHYALASESMRIAFLLKQQARSDTLELRDTYDMSENQARWSWDFQKQEDGTCRIIGYQGSERDVIIPDSIGGCPVTALAPHAFDPTYGRASYPVRYFRQRIVSLFIPESIKELPPYLFSFGHDLKSDLQSVVCGGVPVVNDRTFAGCDPVAVSMPGRGFRQICR